MTTAHLWHRIPGAAGYSNSLSRMAMAGSIQHHHGPIDNSRPASTHVGKLHLHTAAKDGQGVTNHVRRDLQKRGFVGQSDYGLA